MSTKKNDGRYEVSNVQKQRRRNSWEREKSSASKKSPHTHTHTPCAAFVLFHVNQWPDISSTNHIPQAHGINRCLLWFTYNEFSPPVADRHHKFSVALSNLRHQNQKSNCHNVRDKKWVTDLLLIGFLSLILFTTKRTVWNDELHCEPFNSVTIKIFMEENTNIRSCNGIFDVQKPSASSPGLYMIQYIYYTISLIKHGVSKALTMVS